MTLLLRGYDRFLFCGDVVTSQVWLILDGRISISSKDIHGTIRHARELSEGQVSFEWNAAAINKIIVKTLTLPCLYGNSVVEQVGKHTRRAHFSWRKRGSWVSPYLRASSQKLVMYLVRLRLVQ